MRSVTRWAVLGLLVATFAGCAVPSGGARSQGGFALPAFRLGTFTAGAVETPTTAEAGEIRTPADGSDELEDQFEDDLRLLEEELRQAPTVPDPLERWNRAMFRLNDALYFAIVKPFLEGYNKVIPENVRIAIRNFFRNLGTPARVINCMLQGKWQAAETEMFRFAVNTTVGCLGFRDAAAEIHGVWPVNEDLGQTLAVWGLDNGCYLVWPLLGPSTVRDSVGMVGNQFMDPVRYFAPWPVTLGAAAVRVVNEGSFRLGAYEALKAESLDPYVAARQGYIQYRAKQVEE